MRISNPVKNTGAYLRGNFKGFKDEQQKNNGEGTWQYKKDDEKYCQKYKEYKNKKDTRSRGELLGQGDCNLAYIGCQYFTDNQ